jgi:hypothetical protein
MSSLSEVKSTLLGRVKNKRFVAAVRSLLGSIGDGSKLDFLEEFGSHAGRHWDLCGIRHFSLRPNEVDLQLSVLRTVSLKRASPDFVGTQQPVPRTSCTLHEVAPYRRNPCTRTGMRCYIKYIQPQHTTTSGITSSQ